MAWKVEVADYAGEDYWYDFPPLEFDTEEKAREYAAKQDRWPLTKVRRVYEDAA